MKLVYRAIQFMILLLAAGLLLSCTTIHTLPEKFATLEQAFPAGEWAGLPKDLPAGSFKAAVFEAPYEDVFRAVNVLSLIHISEPTRPY